MEMEIWCSTKMGLAAVRSVKQRRLVIGKGQGHRALADVDHPGQAHHRFQQLHPVVFAFGLELGVAGELMQLDLGGGRGLAGA